MLSGMVIPGNMVEEEDEESTEGVSSDGYRAPSRDVYVFKPLATPLVPEGKLERGGIAREPVL